MTDEKVDMLVDIFERNKKFTDFAVRNSPRIGGAKEKAMSIINSMLDDLPPIPENVQLRQRLEEYKQEIPSWTRDEIFILNIIAMYRELGEFVDNFPAKWWGRGTWNEKREEALEELIDLMHFIMIAFDYLGCDGSEIYRRYVEKNNKNWDRFKNKTGWNQNNEIKGPNV